MSFHKADFATRFQTMGDPAESAYDQVYPKSHKLGLNRPGFSMRGMTAAQRYTPDRMFRDRFVECMGCGRDDTLKIKDEKIEALKQWRMLGPVYLFVWSSKRSLYWEEPLEDWLIALAEHGVPGEFTNDSKTFRGLNVSHFPGSPNQP